MAILCEDLDLLYLCTEKTGSTSVSDALVEQLGGRWIPSDHIWDGDQIAVDFKHSSLKNLVDHGLLTEPDVLALNVAITVRNPFAWLVSGYRYRKTVMRQLDELGDAAPAWIVSRRADVERAAVPFDDYVRDECDLRNGSLTAHYLEDFHDHPQLTFLRIETIDHDFNQLLSRLGVGWHIDLPHVNATQGGRYRDMYSDASRAMVEASFARDLAMFDYQF